MDNYYQPKQPNPQHRAWFGSKLFFTWIFPLLWHGSQNGISAANLTECLPADGSAALGDRLESEWNQELVEAVKRRAPKLKRALFRTFSASILPQGILFFIAIVSKSCMPFVFAQLLILFEQDTTLPDVVPSDPDPESRTWTLFQNAWQNKSSVGAFMGTLTLLSSICYHHAEMNQRMLGSRIRIACCSLIFRKTLRMSQSAASQTSAGYLTNLLSNDVGRFDLGFMHSHYIWILPIQTALITFLCYHQIGWAALVGVVCLLLITMPFQTLLSRVLSRIRLRVALKTDERVSIMHEVVRGIQAIKMYAWEPFFRSSVLTARKQELQQVRNASYIRGFNLFASIFSERTTLFVTIIACTLLGQTTTADVVFSLAQYFNVLQLTVAILYPLALANGGEALVSIERVEEFLLLDERAPVSGAESVECSKVNENAIELSQVSAVWDSVFTEHTLQDLTCRVKAGTLCAVVGAVGAGKSSLLHMLLGELPPSAGRISLTKPATISYASQEPWLFNGTVRNNILFGEPYDQERYREVVQSCSLVKDFEHLPKGDQTVVGERGSSLSGGQRARIGLARAVYQKASIYLLDDPLAAVDAHVASHLFENVIGNSGCLAHRKATRVLVTHQVHLLQQADHIIFLDQGRIVQMGTYSELHHQDTITDETDQENNSNLEIEQENVFATKTKTEEHLEVDDLEEEPKSREGAVRVWMQYLRLGSSKWQLIRLFSLVFISQIVISSADFYLTFWTERESLRSDGVLNVDTRMMDLTVYGGFLCLIVIFVLLRSALYFDTCVRTSEALHLRMLTSFLGARMIIFDSNTSGRILNRFSKDLGAVDETLPCAIAESMQTLLLIVGILCVVIILNPAMLIVLAGSVVFIGFLLKLYLRSAQDLKRLEGITRSPVFSKICDCLGGISTIRSCGLETVLVGEFDGLQDVHSAVWRLSMAASTALGLWLDTISVFFVMCITFSFIYAFDDVSSEIVGMSLSQAIILINYVQFGVRQTCLSMQHLVNVERALEYTRLDQETETEVEPAADWPEAGEIRFSKICLRYHPDASPILSDLTLAIQSGWKVGIVGRTGAGKSSLIAALFRLGFIDGSISIDGIDTASIALRCLRSRVSIIPQDPVLFSATIRCNLDPFQQFTDDELWAALEDVELKSFIPMLDCRVTESGSNFSIGQRQLICLARAILRKDRILVLDEATANVDPQTDALIQRTMRERFVGSTVLTVAHRLQTVMDSDRILVLDGGRIVEFNDPHVLLQQPDGLLSQMVRACGHRESESLRQLAENAYVDRSSTDL